MIPACLNAAATISASNGHIDAKSCVELARALYREATREPWKRGDATAADAAFKRLRPDDILYAPIAGDSRNGSA
jgi:hypothetical protein